MLHRQFLLHRRNPNQPPYTYSFKEEFRSGQTSIYDYYGRSVALNDAGNLLFVGSDETSMANIPNGTAGPGRAYIYLKTGAFWSNIPIATLTASDGAINDSFGKSIAVSGDGNTLVVGAPGAKIGNNIRQGAAYVFQWSAANSTWLQTHKLVDPRGTQEDAFGYSVAISNDGTTIAVGSNSDDIIPTYSIGSVHVYSAITLGSGTATIDGDTMTVSAYSPTIGFIGIGTIITGPGVPVNTRVTALVTGTGGAGIYRVSTTSPLLTNIPITVSTSWSVSTRLSASDAKPSDNFGCSVALTSNGSAIAIGASGSDVGTAPNAGAVYHYTRSVTGSVVSYGNQAKISANVPIPGQAYGFSVDMDDAGTAMVIGAPFDDNGGTENNRGCIYVCTKNATVWSQRLLLRSADGAANDKFGWSVATGTNGRFFIVGAPGRDETTFAECGATYIYNNDGRGWAQTAKCVIGPLISGNGDQLGYSVDITPDGITAAMGAPTKSELIPPPPPPPPVPPSPNPNTTYIHGAVYVYQQ